MNEQPPRPLAIAFAQAEWLALLDVAESGNVLPDELAKGWILERLGHLPAVFAAQAVDSGADPPKRQRLGARYRPRDVEVLFVGEAGQAGPSFYEGGSPLCEAVRESCVRALGAVPEGQAFLRWFKKKHFWMWDMPPSSTRKRGRPRKEDVNAETLQLARLIRELGPDHVIGVTASIEPAVRRAAELAQFGENRILILPFPVNQWRRPFVDELAGFFGEPRPEATGAPDPDVATRFASLHEAVVRVLLDGQGRRSTSREIANAIAARDLYRRPDGRHPPASQVGALARRDLWRFEVTSAGIALRGSTP